MPQFVYYLPISKDREESSKDKFSLIKKKKCTLCTVQATVMYLLANI
jgi:hypothetical protein